MQFNNGDRTSHLLENRLRKDWFIENICREYSKHVVRLRQLQPKRHHRRISNLARPKYIMSKVCPGNCSQLKASRKTEIVRELPCLTRTEQLAYPRVRNTLPVRNDFKKILGPARVQVINRTIRKSFLSLYSRLANCQSPAEKPPIEKWSRREWAVHRRYLTKLAEPKKIFKPFKEVHMWKDISVMDRFRYLCKPKECLEHPVPRWELTPSLKKYKATPIIIKLSEPKKIDDNLLLQTLPLKINKAALKYKPSDRIVQLATRAEKRVVENHLKENPFKVVPNALKSKASERIVELAQAKEYEESGNAARNPFAISPAALKAKPTPRIIELSQPKGSS